MGVQRGFLPGGRQQAEAAVVVMSVALDVGDAEQRHHREVLQQGHRAEGAEILAGQDRRCAALLLETQARRVGNALHDALAVLVAGAGVAEGQRARHVTDRAVRFVDDERRTAGPVAQHRGHVVAERVIAVHRLFHDQHVRPEVVQRRLGARLVPVVAKRGDVVEVLVAIERDVPLARRLALEQGDQAAEPRKVARRIAEHLDLEVLKSVGADGGFEILRQAIGDPLAVREVGGGQRVREADGVADTTARDRRGRQQVGWLRRPELRIDIAQTQPQSIRTDHLVQRLAGEPAQPIEHGTLHQADAEMREERRQAAKACPRRLLSFELAPEIEIADRRARDLRRQPRRVRDHLEHLRQILLEGRGRILREPLRRQALAGQSLPRRAAVRDLGDRVQLRHLGHAGDAVAEREAGPRGQDEELKGGEGEVHRIRSKGSLACRRTSSASCPPWATAVRHRPRYKSRPLTSAAILRSATDRFSIQNPQSGCASSRPAPRRARARHARAPRDLVRGFDVVHFDVDHADADADVRPQVAQRLQIRRRPVGELEHQMIGAQRAEKANQHVPGAGLNRLAAVIAETEMDRLRSADGVEHAIDRVGGQRCVRRIAGHVRLVYLDAGAVEVAHLRRQRVGDRQRERAEIAVVLVEQRARQHVGAGQRELERSAGDRGGARAVLGQVQRALVYRPDHHTGRPAAEAHLGLRPERRGLAPSDPGADPAQRGARSIRSSRWCRDD